MAQTIRDLAVDKAGSISNLARICGVTRQAVQTWNHIPLLRIRRVSKQLGIPLDDLIPEEDSCSETQ